MKDSVKKLVIISSFGFVGQALAYEQGDWLIRGGATQVAPDAESSNIQVGGADFALGSTTVGAVDVDNNVQLGLNIAYFVGNKLNIELLAATPFSHDIDLTGDLEGVNLGSTKHLPPTLSVNYFFAAPDAQLQPYIGAGLNYTIFFDEELNDETVGVIEDTASATISDLELDASFGISFQLGADYMLSDNLILNGSVRYIDIETEASFNVEGADLGRVSSVTIDPLVYTLAIGYIF